MRRRKAKTIAKGKKSKTSPKRPNKRGYIILNVRVDQEDSFEQTDYGVVFGKDEVMRKLHLSKAQATEILQMLADELDYEEAEMFFEKYGDK